MARVMSDAATIRLADLCVLYLRRPTAHATDSDTGLPILEFDPPLAADEQTTYATLLALARSGMNHLTPTEYATIRGQLQSLRDLRQMGRNAFMALTAAERDRALYDAQTATTIILLAILRE